jgi:hypothetical protein
MRPSFALLLLAACADKGGDAVDTDTDATDTEVVDTDDTDLVDTDTTDTEVVDTDDTDANPAWDLDGDHCPDALDHVASWQVDSCGHLFVQLAPAARNLRVSTSQTLDPGTYEHGASYVFEAPDAGAAVTMERGPFVGELGCNDVIEHDPVVLQSWTATLGTLTVTVDTTEDGSEPWGQRITTGTIAFEGFTFTDDDSGRTCVMPDVTVTSTWGWFAG